MAMIARLAQTPLLPHPQYEVWAALNIYSKACRDGLIWSADEDSGTSGSLENIPATMEDIICTIYDGHRLPPLVLVSNHDPDSGELLCPRVIHGNKIVQAIVSFEKSYTDFTSERQKRVIRNAQIMVVTYSGVTPAQEEEINETFEKHFMHYTSCIQCIHRKAERKDIEDKMRRIQSIVLDSP